MSDFGENSHVGSKIVRFLWKWMALAEILTKVILLLLKKGKQCAAFGCSNTFYGPNGLPTSLHFFKFPKDTNRRRRWCNLIKRQHGKDGFFVTDSTVVCSEHFRKEYIRTTLTGRWELVSGLSSKDYIHLSLHFLLITLISISPPHCFYRILCLLVALFQLIFE